MRNTTYIYALRCSTSGDIRYVGKANNPKKRFREHLRTDRTASSHKKNWIQSLLSKGLKPKLEILEEVSMDTWKERERYYITKYRKIYKLTNYTDGGEGPFKGNQISFKKGQKSWNKGTRKRKVCAVCGNRFEISPSGDKKYKCCSMRGSSVYRSKNPNKGQFKKGTLNNCSSVKVVQLDKENNIINTYPSIAEASRQTSINQSGISMATRGVHKTAGSFKWKRENQC